MSFTKIGLPHRIVYASKNFVSGLTDVSIKILKPNGSVHTFGLMTEFPDVGFEGIYYFVMPSNSVDPEGEYTVSIVSPTENHKAKSKVTMISNLGGAASGDDSGIELGLEIKRPTLSLNMSKKEAKVNIVTGKIDLNIKNKELDLNTERANVGLAIEPPDLELKIDCA